MPGLNASSVRKFHLHQEERISPTMSLCWGDRSTRIFVLSASNDLIDRSGSSESYHERQHDISMIPLIAETVFKRLKPCFNHFESRSREAIRV